MKKRRHALKLEQYSFETTAGLFSARKVPKKPHWMIGGTPYSLSDLLKSEEWSEPNNLLAFEPNT